MTFLSITGMIRFDNQFRPTKVWIYIRVAGGFYVRLILTRIVVSRQAWTVRAAETTIRFLFYHGARCNYCQRATIISFFFFFFFPSFPHSYFSLLLRKKETRNSLFYFFFFNIFVVFVRVLLSGERSIDWSIDSRRENKGIFNAFVSEVQRQVC